MTPPNHSLISDAAVETLIRGKPEDVRRDVREVLDTFAGNPRLVVATGDQVGYETPEENLIAIVDAVRIP